MVPSDGDSIAGELCRLLASATERVIELVDCEQVWDAPFADSEAGSEMAAENASRDTECWPWLLAATFSRWALQVAVEQGRGLRAVIAQGASSYAAGLLCRGVLECCSLAWWLLEPQIGAERRLRRVLVYRLHTAWQTEHAVAALDRREEDRLEYGELPQAIEKEISDLGFDFSPKRAKANDRRRPPGRFSCGEEVWPGSTQRVAALVKCFWPEPKLPYAVLSAVAHGELLGLSRSLTWRDGESQPRPAAGDADLWLWHDAYLTIGAIIFAARRAAAWLGLHDRLAALDDLAGNLANRLTALRPQPR